MIILDLSVRIIFSKGKYVTNDLRSMVRFLKYRNRENLRLVLGVGVMCPHPSVTSRHQPRSDTLV